MLDEDEHEMKRGRECEDGMIKSGAGVGCSGGARRVRRVLEKCSQDLRRAHKLTPSAISPSPLGLNVSPHVAVYLRMYVCLCICLSLPLWWV